MNNEVEIKMLRKEALRTEAKLKKRECQRIQDQIEALKKSQQELVNEVADHYKEIQEISEWMEERALPHMP